MTEQLPAFAEGTALTQRHQTSQKLEALLGALHRLKSEISGVEERHPGLGNELSSLCDTVITDLNSRHVHDSGGQPADRGNLNITLDKPAAGEPLPPLNQNTNPIAAVFDKAGSHLIAGLDKTGDGIIFLLGKLFPVSAAKADAGTPAEAD
jgi:hypothetical protein